MRFIALFALFLITCSPARADGFSALATGGKGGWINVTRPLTVDDMQGRLVLLDFWTYGCVNCMQIVPELEKLEHEFGDRLLIIGVHSAKFEGEKENSRILAAAKRFGLKHPVINDSDYGIWKAYNIRAWPTLVLLGPDGKEITRYKGEGQGEKLAIDIRKNLDKTSTKSSLANLIDVSEHQSPLNFPSRLASAAGLVFIADAGNHRIVGIDQDGVIKTTIGTGQRGFADGSFESAQFNNPRGITAKGNILYIADTDNHRIRKADLDSKIVITIAGTGEKRKPLASPWDVELIDDKTIAIANAGSHQLFSLNLETNTLSGLAGNGAENIDDGSADQATLAQPSGLSRLGDMLFFVDAESSALRMVVNGQVKTLIGTGLFNFGMKDGQYPDALLQHPQGLHADEKKIVIADTYNNALRLYNRETNTLSTLSLPLGTLNEPGDVLPVGSTLWVANTGGHTVVVVDPAAKTAKTLEIHQ